MLKKENRLKSPKAFKATYNNNNFVTSDILVLYAGRKKIDISCPTRVGFVVSKKISKRAVKRNRIKRLIRENIRLSIKNNSQEIISQYQSLIFVARTGILEKTEEEILKSILTLFTKLANKNI